MQFRVLKNDKDLEEYRLLTARYIDVLLPLDYLKRSRVVACFDKGGELCGGFVIVPEPPFRVLESIPHEARNPKLTEGKKTCEMTGLWLAKNYQRTNASFSLWARMFLEIIFSGRSRFVYAYTMHKKALGNTYAVGRPTVLYRGETIMLPGMNAPEMESVEMSSLWNIITVPFRQPSFAIRRLMKRSANKVTTKSAEA